MSIFIKDVLELINKHSMDVYSYMIFFTPNFALKKRLNFIFGETL